MTTTTNEIDLTDRNTAINEIKKALKARTDRNWSVRGGRGTAYGWIEIRPMPKDCPDGRITDADKKLLASLFGLSEGVTQSGVDVPASGDYRTEYVQRARGEQVTKHASRYWD